MVTTIETVFEKGVFRPLQPVTILENQRVRINFEEDPPNGAACLKHPRLRPREYPDDYPEVAETDFEYTSVPPKSIHTVQARVVFAGKLPPAPYPEDE